MKFYGIVGYCESVEETGDREGNYKDVCTERHYYGDVLRNTRRFDSNTDSTLDDLNMNNSFSILADAYAFEHFWAMKYVCWMGARWKITNVEVQRPRLILTVGGVYNGPTASAAADAEGTV